MNIYLFVIVLFVLQGICLYVGRRASKKLKSSNDYFLAGKNIRFFPLMMTFLATQVGGGLILGSAEEAYRCGWAVLLYPMGTALGLLLLGLGLGRKLASFEVSTVAQILEIAYRSPLLKKIASLLSIFSLFMILVAQVIASHKFLVSLGVDNPIWFMGCWGIVILYTAWGGLRAVVATDLIQAAFFVCLFLLSFCFLLGSLEVPFGQIVAAGWESSLQSTSFSKLYGWCFMPLLFMAIEQDMGQRCFAGESPRTVARATLWAGIGTLLVSLVPIFLGVLALKEGIEVTAGSSVLMTMVKQMGPNWTALISVAILCAIISTADSLINAIGSNLSQDFDSLKCNNLRLPKLLALAISLLALLFSFYFENVVGLLIQSYELSVSCLLVPIVFALFKKQGHRLSASLAMAYGGIGFCLFRWVEFFLPRELLSLLLSLLGYGLGELTLWIRMRLREQDLTL